MTIAPPFHQLDSANAVLGSHGCTLFSAAWLADRATDGHAIVNTRQGIDEAVARFQRLSGTTMADFVKRGTTMDGIDRAFDSFPVEDYMPLRMETIHGASLRDTVLPRLKGGAAALVCVDYGVIQRWRSNPMSGFQGGHAVVILDPHNGMVTMIDPLRRTPISVPIKIIEHAMETFGEHPWGNGRGEAGIVMATPTWQEAYKEAASDLATAKRQVSTLKDSLAVTKGKLVKAQDALDVAKQAASEMTHRLDTALARVTELEAGCAPMEDAARAEGRLAMRDLIVSTTSALT
jgi:hypothetical protein